MRGGVALFGAKAIQLGRLRQVAADIVPSTLAKLHVDARWSRFGITHRCVLDFIREGPGVLCGMHQNFAEIDGLVAALSDRDVAIRSSKRNQDGIARRLAFFIDTSHDNWLDQFAQALDLLR